MLFWRARAIRREKLAEGVFVLPRKSSGRLIRFNIALAEHFRFKSSDEKPSLPATFGKLVEFIIVRGGEAMLRPGNYHAVRNALAAVLHRNPDSIAWSENINHLFPRGRQRRRLWQQFRDAAPCGLPPVEAHPFILQLASLGVIAILIAIAVPIAQRLDRNPATQLEPGVMTELLGHILGVIVFGVVGAILMVPVILLGMHFAPRIPEPYDRLDCLAAQFPGGKNSGDDWTPAETEEHLRDLGMFYVGRAEDDWVTG